MSGVPPFDPYAKDVHFCDPDFTRHHAACGRGEPSVVWIQDVTCPDCLSYAGQYIPYFLERVEEALVVLREMEDA